MTECISYGKGRLFVIRALAGISGDVISRRLDFYCDSPNFGDKVTDTLFHHPFQVPSIVATIRNLPWSS